MAQKLTLHHPLPLTCLMAFPAAKMGDRIIATDIHLVIVPSIPVPITLPLPHPFVGIINSNLSPDVKIMGQPAAMVGSTAINTPPHIPTPPGTAFQKLPSNQGTILIGSPTVKINGKMAARNGDIAQTCNDPTDLPVGQVVAVGTVMIG